MKNYLGIDVGGTFIKYGVFNELGEGKYLGKEPTDINPEAFLGKLVYIIQNTYKENSFVGVGISLPGFINVETGENLDFTVEENFTKYNLKKELKEKTGFNISIENDANCALLAEKWIGNGKTSNDFILATVGTGIGGGIFVNGKILRGNHFASGEFGIMGIGNANNKLEYPRGTSGLVAKVSDYLGKEVNGEFIFENMEKDIKIKEIYDEWILKLAITVSNIAIILDPEKMLIGGGISAQKKFISDLKEKIYVLYPHLKEFLIIEKCKLENNAGMIGAVYNFINEYR